MKPLSHGALSGVIALCLLLPDVSFAQRQAGSVSGELRGVVIPIYGRRPLKLMCVVRAERMFRDHERRGFFRIGLLPLLAAEKVRVEVRDPAFVLDALAQIPSHLQNRKTERLLEWRDMAVWLEGEADPRLVAGRVRIRDRSTWELSDGVRILQDGTEFHCKDAILHIAGSDKRGQITFSDSGALKAIQIFQAPPL